MTMVIKWCADLSIIPDMPIIPITSRSLSPSQFLVQWWHQYSDQPLWAWDLTPIEVTYPTCWGDLCTYWPLFGKRATIGSKGLLPHSVHNSSSCHHGFVLDSPQITLWSQKGPNSCSCFSPWNTPIALVRFPKVWKHLSSVAGVLWADDSLETPVRRGIVPPYNCPPLAFKMKRSHDASLDVFKSRSKRTVLV